MDSKPAEEVVRERAQARADLIVKGDVKGAYEYLSPGSRQGLTSEQYASTIRIGFWKAVTIDKVVCETPNSCDAHMQIDYEFRGSRITTPARETWVKEGSTWWYLRK